MSKLTMVAQGAADINQSAATTNYTTEMPLAGRLFLDSTFIRWTEATGTQATTQGVVGIYVGGNLVASLTANISDDIGESQLFTVDGTYATTGYPFVDFDAGDDIAIKTVTQAVDAGGTVTGDGEVYLNLNFSA